MCREAEETVQQLRALTAFTEDLGLARDSSYRSSASPWASHKLKHAHIQIHTYKCIFNIVITLFMHVCAWCPQRPERGQSSSPELGLDHCEPPTTSSTQKLDR